MAAAVSIPNAPHFVATRGARTQVLAVQDIVAGGLQRLRSLIGERRVHLVYSDPPWNPGNEKYWRNHAGASESTGYEAFVDAWCRCVGACIELGAGHVLCEQSSNDEHRAYVERAMARIASIPLREEWTVFYGSPGSASVRRPNRLLHYGTRPITTDPTGMAGEPMTIRACAGLGLPAGSLVVDPCMGKGMTSRMAHYFDWDCVGTEINPARLQKTIAWLEGQGYAVAEVAG